MKPSTTLIIFISCISIGLIPGARLASAEPAKGTITFKSKSGLVSVDVKHAFLIKGPDPVAGKTIRRIVLSVADVGPALRKCGSMIVF